MDELVNSMENMTKYVSRLTLQQYVLKKTDLIPICFTEISMLLRTNIFSAIV